MSVGLIISRFAVAAVIGVGLFFASMALTLALRTGNERSANAPTNAVVVVTTTAPSTQ